MNQDKTIKKFKSIRDKYHRIQDIDSDLFERFDYAKDVAKCHGCELFNPLNRVLDQDHFIKCKKNRECSYVIKEYNKLYKNRLLMRKIENDYSHSIFVTLSQEKPKLIVRKTKKMIPWNNVFSEKYDELSEEQRYSLISLIEEDGGEYKIDWNDL